MMKIHQLTVFIEVEIGFKFLPTSFIVERRTTVERRIPENHIVSFHEMVHELPDSDSDPEFDNNPSSDYQDSEDNEAQSDHSENSDESASTISISDNESHDDFEINAMAAALTLLHEQEEKNETTTADITNNPACEIHKAFLRNEFETFKT
jgi:cobalamin biosynthesis protein CobT